MGCYEWSSEADHNVNVQTATDPFIMDSTNRTAIILV